MKKIVGLTQRVDFIKSHNEFRDSLDQKWLNFISELNLFPLPLSNNLFENSLSYIRDLNVSAIVFTGGNNLCSVVKEGCSSVRDEFESILLDYAIKNNISVIGVCRGMQLINLHFAGSVENLPAHVATNHLVSKSKYAPIFWKDSFVVNSFHNYGIPLKKLASSFDVLALDKNNYVEAMKHKKLPIYGIMWHPERFEHFKEMDKLFFKKILIGENFD